VVAVPNVVTVGQLHTFLTKGREVNLESYFNNGIALVNSLWNFTYGIWCSIQIQICRLARYAFVLRCWLVSPSVCGAHREVLLSVLTSRDVEGI
jgi:hypothetical protein